MMNRTGNPSVLLAALILTMLSFGACEETGKQGQEDPKGQDTVAVVTHAAETECSDLKPGQFCINGLDFLTLGDSLTWNNNISVDMEGVVLKDTVFAEEVQAESGGDTAAWFVKLVNFPDGKQIFLEADFENPHLMGRIRIESPAYKHTTGLGVGSSVKDLKGQFPDLFPLPFPEFGVMELIVSYSGRRMIFHVPLGDYYVPEKSEYALSDIPEDLEVVRVVLM